MSGCGKSTQLPQYLDDAGWTAKGVIVLDEAHERSANTDLLLGLNFLQHKARHGAAPPPKRPRLRGWDDESGETLQRRAEEGDWRRRWEGRRCEGLRRAGKFHLLSLEDVLSS
eukprot:Skav223600  [mRNA]  locus=scaffold493:341131:344567:- [translate_table: standard]